MLDYLAEYDRYRKLLDGGLEQLADDEFFRQPGADGKGGNSVAIIMKHLAGNFRSRFTDFRTSDGEKPWRNRESEFHVQDETRAEIMQRWEQGWNVMRSAVQQVQEADLTETITIRGKEQTVEEALLRSVTHFSHHVGQVILLARLYRGADWRYLSIPPETPKA
jgi:uncharacterized damage-inducible protein DinB